MSTLDKYQKVSQEPPKTEEHEIRVTGKGRIGMYIVYAAKLFMEKKLTKCVLKGSGPAISKVCQASEILRQRIKGLHEQCRIYSTNVVDMYEPLEEGLDKVEISKSLTVYEVLLSLNEDEVDTKSAGYQAPLPEDQVVEFQLNYQGPSGGMRRGGRGGRRGGRRGGGQRGNGFRRGARRNYRGYDNYDDDYQQSRPQRARRPPRYDDDYDYDQPRRGGGRRYYEDDEYRRPPRRDNEDEYRRPPRRDNEDEYYEQPRRRRGGRRGGRGGAESYGGRGGRNEQYGEYTRDEQPRAPRRARGTRRE